ncbi:hypothetical protein DFH28DRAFT_1113855 [Melampsora americana]|nr:hypothetical protein DFH28DRAFT_1113855 [Melampsora americana]
MLLQDFLDILNANDPHIMDKLESKDIAQFFSIASDLVVRARDGLQLTSTKRPLQYLVASLPASIHPSINLLWKASFSFLPSCHLDPHKMIASNGVLPETVDGRIPIRIAQHYLLPPVRNCPACRTGHALETDTLFGYLYDIDGCRTVQHFSSYCRKCQTTYSPSHYVHKQKRHFYTSSQGQHDKIFHVHKHYFMTHRLAHHFKMSQMLQHSSIFNIVNLYNDTHISPYPPPSLTPTQSFSSALSAGVCKDGMDIHTLLYHFSARSHQLVVPADGLDTA